MRKALNQGLIEYLQASPTPFHATQNLAQALQAAGYRALDEREVWHTEPGGRYYVTRNDSAIVAFQLGSKSLVEHGLRLVGAHTDRPCLRVKPQPELQRQGFWQVGVEVYGGALLAPWFDRDLSLAGRVTYSRDGRIESQLIDFKLPIATIPNLAFTSTGKPIRVGRSTRKMSYRRSSRRSPARKARTSAHCSPISSAVSMGWSPMWCWISN